MDNRYFAFCRADTPYYDLPAADAGDTYLTLSDPLPADWRRSDLAEWRVLTPADVELPDQGWKIHVSATLDNAARVLAVVREYCASRRVAFKHLRDRAALLQRNSKYADRTASGKFITVYPTDEAELARVLAELGTLLDGEQGPYILSDLRWRSGPLFVRYGSIVARMGRGPDGTEGPCLRAPDGSLVPDHRGPSFRPPAWVTLPDCLRDALAARNAGTLHDFPYRATAALHFSNGGGVYLATDLRTERQVLLKEARPLAGLDGDGSDAVTRLERERWALDRLADLECTPDVLDYRVGREHYFLVREFVDGTPLANLILDRNPLLEPGSSAEQRADYARWAQGVLDGVQRGIEAMHAHGVVFGDLHPNNVLVRDDGTVAFIDLETSSPVTAEAGQAIGAPGFRAPDGYRGPAVDRYALGCLRLAVFVPLTTLLTPAPGKLTELIDLVVAHFPVAEDFADRVRADIGPAAGTGPVPDRPAVAPGGSSAAAAWTSPTGPDWPELKASLVRRVLASATPEREDRLYPGDISQFLVPGGGLGFGHGAAGVLWALAEVGVTPPDQHVEWLIDRTGRLTDPRPGFVDGLSGIAYALNRLGRKEQAAEVLDRALALDLDPAAGALLGGLPGLGLVLLHFAATGPEQVHLDLAERVRDRLVEHGVTTSSRGTPPGMLYGSTGGALFLLRLYERTREERLLDLAVQAARADLQRLGWGATGDRARSAPWRSPFLAAGSGALAVVLRDLTTWRPEPDLIAVVDAVREVAKGPFVPNVGLFNGRAGVLTALSRLDDGDPGTAAALDRHLTCLGWHAVRHEGEVAMIGDQSLRLSTDLATGSAGVLVAVQAVTTGRGCAVPFLAPDGED